MKYHQLCAGTARLRCQYGRYLPRESLLAACGMHVFVATLRIVHRLISPDYSKLPPTTTVDMVYLLDPLIATGGTAMAAIAMIVDWGVPGPQHSPPTPTIESYDLI